MENMWAEYEECLKKHDWFYHYSDDHRYWSSGQASHEKINSLRKTLSIENKTRADELFAKYKKG